MSNVVMDVTPNMIFVIGNDMRILDCNRKGQELLGVGHDRSGAGGTYLSLLKQKTSRQHF